MADKMTYTQVGVNYGAMDPFKRMAQKAALETAGNITELGMCEFEPSRGESAYLIDCGDRYIAHVEEGLGTKNLVAESMQQVTGKSFADHVAQDTVAMIVNDLVTLGALPVSICMHLAVGSSDWFHDTNRSADLIRGWQHACNLARCVWGGGETPTLKGVVNSQSIVLAGSAWGIVKPKSRLMMPDKIRVGDRIVFIESSGIHANGLTMARTIADRLPEGYLTKLADGRTYGETLLDPTHIYVPVIKKCFARGIPLHYGVNVTGHGWRKLMRAPQDFTYVIDRLPLQLPIFDFIQQHGPIDDREAYGNLNMGAGFALYVSARSVPAVLEVITSLGFKGFDAGVIEAGEKQVVIRPKNLVFTASTLAVR